MRISDWSSDVCSSDLVATLSDGEHVGRGEGNGVYYLGDDIDHMLAEAQRVRGAIEAGATRDDLQSLLPPGRSEERRVGKDVSTCRSRWSTYHSKKNTNSKQEPLNI